MSKNKIARKEIFENYKCSIKLVNITIKLVNITIKQYGDDKVTYQNFVEKFLEQ